MLIEPINPDNAKEATSALVRAAMFYRGLVNEVTARNPDLMTAIMDDVDGDERWDTVDLADSAVKEWMDFLEIRD